MPLFNEVYFKKNANEQAHQNTMQWSSINCLII